ncbi:MAG TPA: DUF4292 domain-containing protein [Chitinophagaceae bacterium]|nr:DUF4292 domain-containing protein [Chitinophagaceae bacterium]
MIRSVLVIVIISALICSCRSTRKIQTAISKKDTIVVTALPMISKGEDSMSVIKDNYGAIQNNQINFKTFSAKIDVDYEDEGGKNYNVNAHLRMYKDSVIWVSVTAILGIEGLRALITKDSVKLLDKQNKVYTARSVSYLQDVTALPLTLSSLQELLIGNPIFLNSNIVSFSRSAGTISLLCLGDFFKNLYTISDKDKLPVSSKLDDADDKRNRTCYLTYDDFENKKGLFFSTKRSISISEKNTLSIKLDFRQYDFNETLSFPFSVPKNYKPN